MADIPKTSNTTMATNADDNAILSPENDPEGNLHFIQAYLDLKDERSFNWKIKILTKTNPFISHSR